MQKMKWKAPILLTMAAVIWGFAFVAQRVGIQYIGSFTFTGVRFALGAFTLLPLLIIRNIKDKKNNKDVSIETEGIKVGRHADNPAVLRAGIIAGFVLFIAAGLQQIGLEDTTAGKAAFITGFYIVLVPALGIFIKQRVGVKTWIAAFLALAGLYLISVEENFTISRGDLMVFICSFFFAVHILLINRFTQKADALKISFVQYLTCSALSLISALLLEEIQLSAITKAAIPILYGGIFSVGIAYTLQAVGQKYAKASHAAIIMSLESVFALIGGMLILKETLDWRGYAGCLLTLSGVLLSQLRARNREEVNIENGMNLKPGGYADAANRSGAKCHKMSL